MDSELLSAQRDRAAALERAKHERIVDRKCWRYRMGPEGLESRIFDSPEAVPEGWVDSPAKVEAEELVSVSITPAASETMTVVAAGKFDPPAEVKATLPKKRRGRPPKVRE